MRILAGLAFACLLFTTPSFAESETSCYNLTSYETYECLDSENKILARRLNQLYAEIKNLKVNSYFSAYGLSDGDPNKFFTLSQTEWNKYVKANCEMQGLLYLTSQGSGSGIAEKGCYNDAYHQRVNEIEEWIRDYKETYDAR